MTIEKNTTPDTRRAGKQSVCARVGFWLLACLLPYQVLAGDGSDWLSQHNAYRAAHGIAPLRWSETLAAGAQAFANTCPKGHSKTAYGENLAMSSGNLTPGQVVKLWYDEMSQYSYEKPDFSPKTGHFTQVIWQGSQELGCGMATNCSGRMGFVWVCHYDPPGNVQGAFEDNVRPASAMASLPSGQPAPVVAPRIKQQQKAPSFLD